MEERSILARKLIALRDITGLSQARAAEGIGITTQALGNYETGFRKPKYDTLVRIAEYYHVSVDYLLGTEDAEEELSPNTQVLLQTLRGATEDEIAQAIKIIQALRK